MHEPHPDRVEYYATKYAKWRDLNNAFDNWVV